MVIGVSLYCNDQHGVFEGCVRRLEFGEHAVELDAIALDRPPRISFAEFGGREADLAYLRPSVPDQGIQWHCVNGLHFDHVAMDGAVAAELLNFLKSKGTFAIEGGNSDLFEAWQAEGVQFSAQGLEAACAA